MSAVLLVEDELLVRELASEDLGDAGFEVTAASDGDEALGYLREGRQFDLLFTDIRMPGETDGWHCDNLSEDGQAGHDVLVDAGTGVGDLTLDDEQHHEAADDEGQRDSVAQGEERHTDMIVAAITDHHRVFPRI
jgi:CheY-like chemotaxis protein